MMSQRDRNPNSDEGGGVVNRLSTTYQHLLGKKGLRVSRPARLGSEVRDLFAPAPVRESMLAGIAEAVRLNFFAGQLSEASVRLSREKYLITRSGAWFPEIEDRDLDLASQVPEKGFIQEDLPMHWDWHLRVYNQNPEAGAVLLVQPAAAMAVAAAGRLPDDRFLAGVEEFGELALSSSGPADLDACLQHARTILIPGFGVLAHAENIQKVIANIHTVNRLCEIALLAGHINFPLRLNDEE